MSARTSRLTLAMCLVVLRPALAHAQDAAANAPDATDRSERVARATAIVNVSGRNETALGLVLAGDGRIVVSSRFLGNATSLDVRYPDGRRDVATLVGTDDAWGISLLEPRSGMWREGLALATAARANTAVRWAAGSPVQSRQGTLRRRRTYVGSDGSLLRDAWELDPQPSEASNGSGIANAAGALVAMIVVPDPNGANGSTSTPYGVPASIVRDLITRTGPSTRPYLGLVARDLRRGEVPRVRAGLRVTDVAADSPAATAGFIGGADGDVIITAEGNAVRSTGDIARLLQQHRAGDTVVFRVLRGSEQFDISVDLGAYPMPP